MGSRFGFLPFVLMIMLSQGLNNHVFLVPSLLDHAGRDAWLSVLLGGVVFLVFIPPISMVAKGLDGLPMLIVVRNSLGRTGEWAMIVLLTGMSLAIGSFTLRDTTFWTATMYLPETPSFLVAGSGIFICGLTAWLGLRTVLIVSGVLFPAVAALGEFVAISNFRYKEGYELLFPILENGYRPLMHGTFCALAAYMELAIMLLIVYRLRRPPSLLAWMIVGVLLVGLTIGPTSGSIAEFGAAEAAKQRYPAFEQWRLVEIGNYIEHVDFFSIFQWLSGGLVRYSLTFVFVETIFHKWIVRRRKRKLLVFALYSLICFALYALPVSDWTFYLWISQGFYPLSLGISLLTLGIAMAAVIVRRRRKEGPYAESNG